jgi:hypothetical protein
MLSSRVFAPVLMLAAAGCAFVLDDDYDITEDAQRGGEGGGEGDVASATATSGGSDSGGGESPASTGAMSSTSTGPAEPSCDADGAQNGDETDIDCGGVTCPPCADELSCLVATDCTSAICKDHRCAKPRCDDHVKNGLETDVDCGGACPHCKPGMDCLVAADCDQNVCIAGQCGTQCQNAKKDGAETDIDCGGSVCPACGSGDACEGESDCLSGSCRDHVCQ